MSGFTIEKLPGEPIVLGHTLDEWRTSTHLSTWIETLSQLLDSLNEPVFYVGDLIKGHPWTMDETLMTASAVARGDSTILHHPKMKETLIVTDQPVVRAGAKSLQSNMFGNVRIKVFSSVDEALAYARSR